MAGDGTWRNWAGNQRAGAVDVVHPADAEAIATALVQAAAAGRRVRPIGSGHSFTAIGRPEDVQLVLDRHDRLVGIDDSGLVTVQSGMPLHRLNAELAARGWSLTNLGDIDRQTVSGALSTGTHGTGARFGGLATQLRALVLVLPDGSRLQCSATENADVFAAARVGLGALGVLDTVTLQAEPAFALRAEEGPARLGELLEGFDEFMTSTDHVEFYWFPHTSRCLTKRNTRVPLDAGLSPLPRWRAVWEDEVLSNAVFAGIVAAGRRRPERIPRLAAFASGGLGARTWTDASHRVFVSRRRVRFLEMEYAVPRAEAPAILTELHRIAKAGSSTPPSPWRSGWPPPTTSPCPPPPAATPPTSPRTCRPAPSPVRGSPRSSRWPAASAAGRTGASCTAWTPPRCAPATRVSTSSPRCARGWTRPACSATPTWTACSARSAAEPPPGPVAG